MSYFNPINSLVEITLTSLPGMSDIVVSFCWILFLSLKSSVTSVDFSSYVATTYDVS